MLDTNILIWLADSDAAGSQRLDISTRALISDRENHVAFSVVGIWEVAIKFALRRTGFALDPCDLLEGLREAGFEELAMTSEHALAVPALPWIHRDPFDRMLLAQAQVEGLTLLTADETLTRYPASVRLI